MKPPVAIAAKFVEEGDCRELERILDIYSWIAQETLDTKVPAHSRLSGTVAVSSSSWVSLCRPPRHTCLSLPPPLSDITWFPPAQKDATRNTLLHLACWYSNSEAVEILIKREADPSAANNVRHASYHNGLSGCRVARGRACLSLLTCVPSNAAQLQSVVPRPPRTHAPVLPVPNQRWATPPCTSHPSRGT